MSIIYYHKLNIIHATEWNHKDEFKVEAYEILAENDSFIVIKDLFFTRLSKDKSYLFDLIDQPVVSFKDILGDKGIFFRLYSRKIMTNKAIQKHIIKKIEKEYGWLNKPIDFSIMDKKRQMRNDTRF